MLQFTDCKSDHNLIDITSCVIDPCMESIIIHSMRQRSIISFVLTSSVCFHYIITFAEGEGYVIGGF